MRNKWKILVLFVVGIMFMCGYGIYRSKHFSSEKPAGVAANAQFHPATGFLGESSTTVDTDRGVYLVEGTFQTIKGHTLVIQTNWNGQQFLSDKEIGLSRQLK